MSLKGLFLSLYDLNTTTACAFVGQFSLSFLSKGWPPTWRSTQWKKSGMGAKRHSWCFLSLQMPMGFTESPWPHRMGKFSTDSHKGKHKPLKVTSHWFSVLWFWRGPTGEDPIPSITVMEENAEPLPLGEVPLSSQLWWESKSYPRKLCVQCLALERSFSFCSVKFSESPYLLAGQLFLHTMGS